MPVAYGYRWLTGPDKRRRRGVRPGDRHDQQQIGADNVAAIIIEPVLGAGGFIEPAKGFLPAISKFAKDNGIVFVADEIQSGFCRTGQWFACEDEGIVPDLITTAKGIAGGFCPLAAVTGRAEIMDAAHAGGLGGTYWAATRWPARRARRDRDDEGKLDLNAKAKNIEAVMKARLGAMAEKFDVIGDVRGRGAMIAIELVKDRATKEPNPEATAALAKACHQEGLLVLTRWTTATSSASCRRWSS